MAQNWRELISLYEVSGNVYAFDLFNGRTNCGLSPLFPSTADAYAWKKAKESSLRGVTMRLRVVKKARRNPKKPEDRAARAVRRVQEALQAGVILHFSTNLGSGTAGPWHAAVDGGNKFAIFQDQRTRPREDFYPSAFGAADHLVAFIGVGNVISALKAAGRKNGTPYVNLDTPIRWR